MSTQVQFDAAASRLSTSRTSDGSVLAQIHRAAQSAGLDPTAELYNEALELAKDGHYRQARDRLHVLLGLAPSDGDAHLLLAKVHVAGQRWRPALAALDEAAQCGTKVPEALRDAVVRHLQAEDTAPEDAEVREIREQGELRKLRTEVRSLRSENAHLAGTNRKLQREAALMSWVATATSVAGMVLVLALVLVGGSAADAPAVAAPPDDPDAAVAGAAAGGAVEDALALPEAQVRDPGMQAFVEEVLRNAGVGSGLTVAVRGTTASLGGSVPSHDALKAALTAASDIDGIDKVVADGVVVLARRDGTTYTVRSGDSLSVIAYRLYGDQALAGRILDANPELGGRADKLQIGQTLRVPPAP